MIALSYETLVRRWHPYFALADANGDVSLLCSVGAPSFAFDRGNRVHYPQDEFEIPFYVINGAWSGVFYRKLNMVTCLLDGQPDPESENLAYLVWAGHWPEHIPGNDYNSVIAWITSNLS